MVCCQKGLKWAVSLEGGEESGEGREAAAAALNISLNLHFQATGDVEYITTYVLVICLPILVKCVFKTFAQIPTELGDCISLLGLL